MMKTYLLITLVALGFSGCSDANRMPTAAANKTDPTTTTADRDHMAVDRDNTAVNERDRGATLKTPLDQNETKTDIDITANIRKRVVDTDMSLNAKNIKIITQDGKVTLRGPVKSADEKKQIEEMAHAVAGADKVDSQLDIE
jgi:hyperosmotically inducible periplasmic protein